MAKKYRVTITETLKRTVDVTAESKEAAEQIVGDEWYSGKHILTADDFIGVEFEANTIKERTETNGRIKKGLLRGHV